MAETDVPNTAAAEAALALFAEGATLSEAALAEISRLKPADVHKFFLKFQNES